MQGEPKKMSRRDLLMGAVRRIRGDQWNEAPSGVEPLAVEADRLLREGEIEAAVAKYREVLDGEPLHFEARRKTGYCRYMLGEMEAAREAFEEVMHHRPRDPFCLLYLGLSHAKEGNLEWAMSAWRGYFNLEQHLVQRAVNVHMALYEDGEELDALTVAGAIETAIEEQGRG